MAGTTAQIPTATKPGASEITRDDYRFLQEYVYRESGIVLDSDKHYLLEARLMPIVHKESLQDIRDLCNLLRGIEQYRLRRQVVEAMTTSETLFFRELPQYEALRTRIIPQLMTERTTTRKLSFWSAAASSGQEAYSLAMMLLEMDLRGWNIDIVATDLNESVLDRARQGRFMQIEVNRGLPVNYLLKYFQRHGLEWQLKDEVRRMVGFQRFDLRESMRTKGPFDVIFCRNVLIYFDIQTRRRILAELHGALFRSGHLLLGGAETTFNLDDQFRRVEVGSAVLHQAI